MIFSNLKVRSHPKLVTILVGSIACIALGSIHLGIVFLIGAAIGSFSITA